MRNKKVTVTGATGFIGTRIFQLLGHKFPLSPLPPSVDIIDRENLIKVLRKESPEIILHIAAKAHIDYCETGRKSGQKSEVWRVNAEGTRNITGYCRQTGTKLVYLSTECVFDGEKTGGYTEDDKPNPKSFYGMTKYEAESVIQKSEIDYLILRAVLAYGHVQPNPHDLFYLFYSQLKEGKTLKAVSDQKINPTYIDELVNTISTLIRNKAKGIYHFGGSNITTPFEFGGLVKTLGQLKGRVIPVALKDYFGKSAVYRLKNAVLNSDKIRKDYRIVHPDLSLIIKSLIRRNG